MEQKTGSLQAERIEPVVAATIAAHTDRVQEWIANRPGAWGYLAGQAVLSCRRELGRGLDENERRLVWSILWQRLLELRRE
ncbi:MAG: hypothetical protein ACR2PL_09450 [Dehalococcoidia bacterium]